MSKLIFLSLILVLTAACNPMTSVGAKEKTDLSHVWGKSQGAIALRIVEQEVNGDIITLRGEIDTKLPEFQIEWKLPPGVTLVSGVLDETATHEKGQDIVIRRLRVQASPESASQHIVLQAYITAGDKRIGTSRVYQIRPPVEATSKVEKVQQLMKARGSKPRL